MKFKLLFVLLLVFVINVNGQVLNWDWAKSAGGSSYDWGSRIAVDDNGNSYVTGVFDSPTISFGNTILNNAGVSDLFIAKFNSSGKILWAKNAGGTGADLATGLAIDSYGNIFLCGYFQSHEFILGLDTLINTGGGSNLFVAKFDSSGNVLWANSSIGTDYDLCNSIAIDASGNLYIAGSFNSPVITFDGTTLNNVSTFGNTYDGFIAKYDATGNNIWAKSVGGANLDKINSISVDENGNSFIGGFYASSIITIDSITLSNASGSSLQILIVKLDSSGKAIWAKSVNGSQHDKCNRIVADNGGYLFITGEFESPSLPFGSFTLHKVGYKDIFISKWDSDGNVIWAKSAGGSSEDDGTDLIEDNNGNIYLTGSFLSTTISFDNITLTNKGDYDFFIAKYDSLGNVLWAKSEGGSKPEYTSSITKDSNGNLFVTGYFYSSTLVLDNTILSNTPGGYYDLFIAKLSSSLLQQNNLDNIIIFPNPTHSTFTLTTNTSLTNPQIEIYNMMGAIVYTEKVTTTGANFSKQINLNAPAGIYFVKLSDGEKQYTKKLVVE